GAPRRAGDPLQPRGGARRRRRGRARARARRGRAGGARRARARAPGRSPAPPRGGRRAGRATGARARARRAAAPTRARSCAEGYRIGEAATLLGGAIDETSADPAALREAMLRAIREADQARLGNLLDQAFALHPVERALGEIVHPVLTSVGEGWERGELSVA